MKKLFLFLALFCSSKNGLFQLTNVNGQKPQVAPRMEEITYVDNKESAAFVIRSLKELSTEIKDQRRLNLLDQLIKQMRIGLTFNADYTAISDDVDGWFAQNITCFKNNPSVLKVLNDFKTTCLTKAQELYKFVDNKEYAAFVIRSVKKLSETINYQYTVWKLNSLNQYMKQMELGLTFNADYTAISVDVDGWFAQNIACFKNNSSVLKVLNDFKTTCLTKAQELYKAKKASKGKK